MRVVGFILQILRFVTLNSFRFLASISAGQTSTGTHSNTDSSNNRTPSEVRINDDWYSVSKGWAGGLDLYKSTSSEKYTAREPYIHISNLYFVYDPNGNKVGEFDTKNWSYSGRVTGLK